MAHETETDKGLEALFAEARSEGPSDALMARVLADAAAVQAKVVTPAPMAASSGRGWLAGVIEEIGGWGALSGVTAAGVMGLALGLYTPDTVVDWIGAETLGLDATAYDITPDMAGLWGEGDDV